MLNQVRVYKFFKSLDQLTYAQFQWLNPFQSAPTMRPVQRHGKNLNFNPETPKLLQMFPGSPLVLHLFQNHGKFNCETDLMY